ncbi:hypothetical protein L810_4658 [Burkholderia sp. AU4i]|nr:hypothetical protein L810_4658 [Burkholderia sp. AU4i]
MPFFMASRAACRRRAPPGSHRARIVSVSCPRRVAGCRNTLDYGTRLVM